MTDLEIVKGYLARTGEVVRYITERTGSIEVGVGYRAVAYFVIANGRIVDIIWD